MMVVEHRAQLTMPRGEKISPRDILSLNQNTGVVNCSHYGAWYLHLHTYIYLHTYKRESPLTLLPNSSLEKAPIGTYGVSIDQEFYGLPARELGFLKFCVVLAQ